MTNIEKFKLIDKKLADLYYFSLNENDYEEKPTIITTEVKNNLLQRLAQLEKQTIELEEFSNPAKIWKQHYLDFINEQKLRFENIDKNYAGLISGIYEKIERVYRTDFRNAETRLRVIKNRTAFIDEVTEYLLNIDLTDKEKISVKQQVDNDIELLSEIMEITDEYFDSYVNEVKETLLVYQNKLKEFSFNPKWLNECVEETKDENKTFKFEESYYRHVLKDSLGVNLDELLSWYQKEVDESRKEVFDIVNSFKDLNLNVTNMQEVVEVLNTYAGSYSDINVMFEKGREYLDIAQKSAREYIYLPEEESCRVIKVPRSLKFSYPWGGYEGIDEKTEPILGTFFLNEVNYKAVTDGWIKVMAVHEAYPGHHCQAVRNHLGSIPLTAKIGSKCIPLIEGTAHRSERMMEHIFKDDRYYPLFVAYRRHHTAVRIKADLMLRYFGNPVSDIVKLYMDEMGFDYNTARGQLKAQEFMEGYFTCYYYGLKKLENWQKEYGYDDKTFTEFLFSVGGISLDNFEAFLKLDENDKKAFMTQFGH